MVYTSNEMIISPVMKKELKVKMNRVVSNEAIRTKHNFSMDKKS